MPITHRIDHAHRLVIARGYALFAAADVFEYQRQVWSQPEVAGYDEIIDMTHVTDVDLPSAQRIRDLASISAGMDVPQSSRFAIVAPTDLAFGLGRMFQVYREAETRSTKAVGVFRTMADAAAFLNLTEMPPLPPLPAGFVPRTA